MKQATTGNKDIIKKLLTDSLSPEEREKLNNYKFVNQAIYSQWEQASDMYTDVDKDSFIADLRNTIFNVIIQKSRAGGLVCTELRTPVNGFGKISRWYACDAERRESLDIS